MSKREVIEPIPGDRQAVCRAPRKGQLKEDDNVSRSLSQGVPKSTKIDSTLAKAIAAMER